MRTKQWWLWVAADELYTYLLASPTRARSAPDEAGVIGDVAGVMVHDRLAMYFSYDEATRRVRARCERGVLRAPADTLLELGDPRALLLDLSLPRALVAGPYRLGD